ncbi:hypothetical protein [Trinickia sp. Y13]|uniref:hypothetical protein n=1 Tax=Trinickia sp. Y13 TaxID=2917807 RepID=UPI002407477F|nr:hypothetical protein [Trinickia sp. Y13]MDG0022793.1 hypothetical protein [Trinickia sp. Y13]
MRSNGELEKGRPAGALLRGGRDMRLCLGLRSGETLLGKVPLSGTGSGRHNDVACGCFVFLSRSRAHSVGKPVSLLPSSVTRRSRASAANRSGASMDLAMAMGLSLFGIFTASTVLFFFRLAR